MVKTRFAPSPTGYLHVGSLRTALYAYLFAKKNNGKCILRIEDTDQKRFVEGSLENLFKVFDWAGIEFDEGPTLEGKDNGEFGPYIQSQRSEIYQREVQKLIDSGHAYHCFCSKERLDEMREKQKERGLPTMYDRHCLKLPESEVKAKLAANEEFVIRHKMPYEIIKFKDIVRGKMKFDGKIIDDQVLMKSDGLPTYHLANVVDDHYMQITHVIRAEEWLPSTPKHIALYRAFGWEEPEFAHLALLLNEDRTKLSKRQGHVAVEEYIKEGYLKEAVINFVTFLGWHPGAETKKEIFTLKELEEIFTLEKVHKAGAIFNLEKLDWFNWQWKKIKLEEKLVTEAKKIDQAVEIKDSKKGKQFHLSTSQKNDEFLLKKGKILLNDHKEFIDERFSKNERLLTKAISVLEEKILKSPKEINQELEAFYELSNYSKELLTHEKMSVNLELAEQSLELCKKGLSDLKNWTFSDIKEKLIEIIKANEIKTGQLLWPLRSALSGKEFSPGAIELAWALEKEETIKRIDQALQLI